MIHKRPPNHAMHLQPPWPPRTVLLELGCAVGPILMAWLGHGGTIGGLRDVEKRTEGCYSSRFNHFTWYHFNLEMQQNHHWSQEVVIEPTLVQLILANQSFAWLTTILCHMHGLFSTFINHRITSMLSSRHHEPLLPRMTATVQFPRWTTINFTNSAACGREAMGSSRCCVPIRTGAAVRFTGCTLRSAVLFWSFWMIEPWLTIVILLHSYYISLSPS